MRIGAALVLPPTILGMIEASATESPEMPCTPMVAGSTTAGASRPILAVPAGW